MNILKAMRGMLETRATGDDPSWNALAGGAASASGAHADAKAAESLTAVYACVGALSESVSTLPLHVYRRTDDGNRERADGHWLSRLLDRPNDWQTGVEFRESQTAAVLLHGNAYARKELNGSGEVTALHPMHPQRVAIVRLDSGRYRYDYTDDDGRVVRLLPDEVMHLRDRTEPGSIVGKSRIAIARESLGLSLALRAHGTGVFTRGARPASIITNERAQDLDSPQLNALAERLSHYANPANSGKTLILPKGMKYASVGLSNEDAQWLEAMQLGTTEICRLFRVPPILVQDLSNATYSNVTELGLQFVRFSLQRWLTAWEKGVSRSLLGPIARQRIYAEHAIEGLLRGNPEVRADFYGKAIKDGWMDVDEVRKLESLPPRSVDATPRNDATS